jgi:RHS repeat-associated protein
VSQVDLNVNGRTTTLASNISYVPFGPVENFLYGNGTGLTQAFDAAYRLISQQIPGLMDLGYLLYDPNGNLMTRTDSFSSTATFNYDALDRLVTGAGSFGSRDYNYDLNGNRTFLDDGSITDYGYSTASNRLLSETGWTYTVDPNGNTTKKINIDGEGRIYAYNSHNRLVTVSDRSATPARGKNKPPVITDTVIGAYNYNGLGQRTSKDVNGIGKQFLYGTDGALMAELDVAGAAQREYIYLNSQLLAVLDHGSSDINGPEETIVDNGAAPAGWAINTSKKDYGNGYLYSEGGTGNPIRWTPSMSAGNYEVYAWYVKNKKYSSSVPYTISHAGQADTINVDQSTGGNSWILLGTYSFDGTGNEYVEVSDATGKTTADAVRFIEVAGGSAPTTTALSYVHNDHLGTPQVMTNEAGNVVWRATYDPFGAATVDASSTVEMNVRFPGQYFDEETGLQYSYFRYYCPDIGRYLTADPIGLAGGLNTFTYVFNNPTGYTDPDGLEPYLVSRRLAFTSLASHNFVVSNADYISDPNASIHSFGMNNFGKTGRVDQNTRGFSDTTSIDDANFWKGLSTNSCSVTNSNASPIPASDATVDQYSKYLIENTDYAAFAGIFGTNSNSAASALANISAGVPVPIPGPSYRVSPGAGNAHQIQFGGP